MKARALGPDHQHQLARGQDRRPHRRHGVLGLKGALGALTFSLRARARGARRHRQRDRPGLRAHADGHRAAERGAQRQALLAQIPVGRFCGPRSSRTSCAFSPRRSRASSPARSSISTAACRWTDPDERSRRTPDYARHLAGRLRPAPAAPPSMPGGYGGIGGAIAWELAMARRAGRGRQPERGQGRGAGQRAAGAPATGDRPGRWTPTSPSRSAPPVDAVAAPLRRASTCSSTASASSARSASLDGQRSGLRRGGAGQPQGGDVPRPGRRPAPGRGGRAPAAPGPPGAPALGPARSSACATAAIPRTARPGRAGDADQSSTRSSLSAHGITVNGVAPTAVVRGEMARTGSPTRRPASTSWRPHSARPRRRAGGRGRADPLLLQPGARRSSPGRSMTHRWRPHRRSSPRGCSDNLRQSLIERRPYPICSMVGTMSYLPPLTETLS